MDIVLRFAPTKKLDMNVVAEKDTSWRKMEERVKVCRQTKSVFLRNQEIHLFAL